MFGKIKKVFFTGVFGALYISFLAQLVWIVACLGNFDGELDVKLLGLAGLSLEWLILIAARYLSKRSSNNAQYNGGYGRRR
ncbi:MAG: hypothetical protein IJY99_04785 [Alphaproteobacteria bacterium]|nr:hypothetical protein [Alphaproteobacteria bacterium]